MVANEHLLCASIVFDVLSHLFLYRKVYVSILTDFTDEETRAQRGSMNSLSLCSSGAVSRGDRLLVFGISTLQYDTMLFLFCHVDGDPREKLQRGAGLEP